MVEAPTSGEYERQLRAQPADLRRADCPSRATLDLVATKWAPLVIAALDRGVARNGALLREIEGISQKMLTQTLRTLVQHGLVTRTVHEQVPPKVEYHLTPLAEGIVPIIHDLCRWAETSTVAVQLARHAGRH